MKVIEDIQFADALNKYAEAFILKRRKSKSEKQLTDSKHLYVIYARKSTEDDKRQVQSIEDQIDHCRKFAKQNGLEVVEVLREEKSAKIAGRRLQFQQMLSVIKEGKFYNSILTWHPDRLARNMKESGEILDLLDKDIIVDLKFPSYSFNNDAAGKMTLSILFAMAKEFSDKLSDDTKRGIEKKVREGKYCGSVKRGYYGSPKTSYYRPDESFELYKQAWQDYKSCKTQKQILEDLKEKGENITGNMLSNFFMDPFYSGVYCYGDQIVNIKSVDPDFKAMVSPKDFMMVQKMNRENPRGWKISEEFRPFNELLICSDCGRLMTAGVSKGKSDRYLSITCGNGKCKEKRRNNGITPIGNTVRGKAILDFSIDFIQNKLHTDQKTYQKAKEEYFNARNYILKENKGEISSLRSKKTKLEKDIEKISKRLVDESNRDVAKKLSNDCSILLNQIRVLERDIQNYEIQNKEYELTMETEFPEYKEFVNFFGNAVTVLKTTDNAYLIDQLIKLVFVNIIVGDKKVLSYELREPFKSYESLKFLHGVDNGT